MRRLCVKSLCVPQNVMFSTKSWILLIVLLSSLVNSHVIQKRHDIIENPDSIDHANSPTDSKVDFSAEHDGSFMDESDENVDYTQGDKDEINNDESNNIVHNSKQAKNAIEQNFGGQATTNNNNSTRNATEIINSSNLYENFTKDFSQESTENRLPSKISDKSVPKAANTAVPLKDSTKVEQSEEVQRTAASPKTQSSSSRTTTTTTTTTTISSNNFDKPKRIDASFAMSTERAAADLVSSTIPISRSTASILSTGPLTPRITTTDTMRSRISSISPEVIADVKRAKYLSDPHTGSSSPSSVSSAEASWSDLKTVGEVHHNNVTLGRSSATDEPLKLVNGKLDSEEVLEKSSGVKSVTEKNAEEHETQLQKSNSKRIVDLPDDNSLNSFHSSSNRPIAPVTKRTEPIKPLDRSHKATQTAPSEVVDLNSSVENPKSQNVKTTNASTNATESVKNDDEIATFMTTTEYVQNNEGTTEKVEYSTAEDELATNIDDSGTTTIDESTTISNLAKSKSEKTKENIVLGETTTIIPTTEDEETENTTVFMAKAEENKIQHDRTQNVSSTRKTTETFGTSSTSVIKSSTAPMISSTEGLTSNSTAKPASVNVDNTTPFASTETAMITHDVIHPTKVKPTQTNQKFVANSTESVDAHYEHVSESSSTAKTLQNSSSTEMPTTHPSTHSHESTVTTGVAPVSISSRKNPATSDVSGLQKSVNNNSTALEHQTEIAQVPDGEPTDVNAMIAIAISIVAVVSLILLVGFLFVMRKRQKQLTYGQRCRPIGLDAYSLDNISVYNSVRRKSAIRTSKRVFGNAGFDDPGLKNNPLNISQLAIFSQKRVTINDEFRDVPTVTARIEEVPIGCEDKNRYANVVPLPESRVHLKQLGDDEKTEYINANYVKGPKDTTHYYIACQAPLEHTIIDFWRMIWEQNSRVIIMATDLTENGIEKCVEYLPSSFVIDNHVTFGDYQIILKNREVHDKYAVSTVHLKNACTKTWREITHFWYQWPENGVPSDEASIIAMLLEARSYLKMITPEQKSENGQQESDFDESMSNGSADKTKSLQRVQGPLTVHCSPGTGRTGTIIACDIAIRSLEQPTRTVDIPQIVYFVRRGRASAVQTREQYEFIYKVAQIYATKLTGPASDN